MLALAVSACGGGGGGSTSSPIVSTPAPPPTPPPPPPPPPPPTTGFNTAEYQRSNAAVAANAITAYNLGFTGSGVKIGIVDTGIVTTLADFAGKIDPASRDVAGSRGLGDDSGHGTAVADVAAGAKNDLGIHGVAFNSTIVALRADTPGSCAMPETDTGGGCEFNDGAIGSGIDAARVAGAKVVNLSLGGSAPNSSLLAAMGRAVSAGMVLVISAGNEGDTPEGVNPDLFALVPARQFAGSVIIAGSVGVNDGAGGTALDQLSTFSNKAGTGASNYLAALGYRVQAISDDGQQYRWSGTSFSAPAISGSVALLAQAFPNLTGQEIVSILFRTADDLGAVGTDTTFGRGRLNLTRAFAPIGTTSLAGSQIAVSTSDNGVLPGVAGDAGAKGPLGVVILDGYSRAYALDFAKTLRQATLSRPLERALSGRMQGGSAVAGPFSVAMTVARGSGSDRDFELSRLGIGPKDAQRARLIAGSAVARIDDRTAAAFGFAEGAKAMERRLSGVDGGSFLIAKDIAAETGFSVNRGQSVALRRRIGAVGVTVSTESGKVWREFSTSPIGADYRLTSLAVDRRMGASWVSLGMTRLEEQRTLLGGAMGAALGGGGSSSLFMDLEARRDLGRRISVGLSARRGWTTFGAGRFQTDAYAFDVARDGLFGVGDRIGLRISQPLRIASGGITALLPTGYDYVSRTATSSIERFSLAPSGREIDAELSYGAAVMRTGWLGGNLYVRRQPDHVARADDDVGAAIRFTLGF